MAKKDHWKKFPHADKAYHYAGAALKKNWGRLHLGDAEAYPDEAGLKALLKANPGLAEVAGDLTATAEALQAAWRLYHAGEFQKAHEAGLELGLLGHSVANKSASIWAKRSLGASSDSPRGWSGSGAASEWRSRLESVLTKA